MGVLNGKRCYLSGPIEFSTGPDWRPEAKEVLKDFCLDLFDPLADPKQQWHAPLKAAQERADYGTMAHIARQFVRKDLAMVDRADMLIAYLPHKVPTTGTIHEIINSVNAKKPVLLICPQGKNWAPLWLFGIVPHEVIFGSWADLKAYLVEVEAGLHKDNNRWHFIYGLI